MNGSQITVLLFSIIIIVVDVWAIIEIARTPELRLKPLWIIGSLFGFIGLGVDWSQPDDIFVLFGITIPVVMIFTIGGHAIVKTGLPFVAIVALAKIRSSKAT